MKHILFLSNKCTYYVQGSVESRIESTQDEIKVFVSRIIRNCKRHVEVYNISTLYS